MVTWICKNCYIDFSELLHGFIKVATWICLCFYTDSSKLFYVFLAKQSQAEVWPRFQSFLKLLLWFKGVERVKVLYALGPLCLWRCFCLDFGRFISMIVLQRFNAACLVAFVLFVNWIWYVSNNSVSLDKLIIARIKSSGVCFVDVFGGEWIAAQLVISQLWSPSHRQFYTCGSDGLAKQ